ncbi:MAG: sulfotransferase domain-containing protein [Candidatus Pacearchaeota archaeon]|nr:sulfotransferase domain-containing protein [Candidatus Pacearchaeota archaeon]
MKKNNYLYIFLHPPRSGGESLSKFFERNLPADETIRIDTSKLSDNPKEREKLRFLSGHSAYFGIHKKVSGKKPRYLTVIRDPAEWLVSLYHSRMQDFPENKKQSFEEWYSLQKKNSLIIYFDEVFRSTDDKVVLLYAIKRRLRERILDKLDKTKTIHTFLKKLRRKQDSPGTENERFENAKKLLEECWFICITETLKNDMKILFNLIGIKADWKEYEVLSNIPRKMFVLDKKTREKIYRENSLDLKLYKYALKLSQEKKKKLQAQLR